MLGWSLMLGQVGRLLVMSKNLRLVLLVATIASASSFASLGGRLSLPSQASSACRKLTAHARVAPARVRRGEARRGVRMQGEEEEERKRVVIVGGGPAGLLAAHLLGRSWRYDVTVLEGRGDPRVSAMASVRSYSLGIGVRGRAAIRSVSEELWEGVKARGVECDKFSLHLGKRVIQIRQKSAMLVSEPSVLLNRADLCSALLDGLTSLPRERLQLRFSSRCTGVDLEGRRVRWEEEGREQELAYDLLIAADGVNSRVREELLRDSSSSLLYASAPLNGTLKVIHQKMPAALDPNSVHAMSGEVTLGEGEARERIGMFWVPERNRTTGEQQGCALLNWDVSNEPRTLLGMEEAEEVQAYFNKAFPSLQDGITLEAAEQFLRQTPSVNYVNKCSRYHDSRSRILLLGDAAHCTGGASGQGCNSALQDAASLWRTLEECEHDLERAMEKFSEERVPEGHALLDLSIHQSPRDPLLRVAFLLLNGVESLGHRLLPSLISPPTQNLLTQTDLPFTEIYRRKSWILDIIKRSNAKFGAFTGY